MQARLADPEVLRDLRDRRLTLAGDRDHVTTELRWERFRHSRHPSSEEHILTAQESTEPGAVPIVPALDNWLLTVFAPHRLTDTIHRLHTAQPHTEPNTTTPNITAANKIIAACDAKLHQYRAIADAGGDATTIATWITEVNAQRAAALAQRATATATATATAQKQSPDRLTENDIRRLVGSFDNIRNTLRDARSEDKRTVYRELRLTLTYNPGQNKISVEAKPDADYCGVTVRVRGATRTVTPPPMTIVKTLKPTQA